VKLCGWLKRKLNEPLGIFTLLLVIVAALQWGTLERTDQTLKRTLLISERAFVHLDDVAITAADNWVSDSECDKAGHCVFNVPRNMGKMIHSEFLFTNSGNTPARHAKIMIECREVGFAEKRPADPFDWLKWDDSKVIKRSIGAKQQISVSLDDCDFKNGDVLLNAQMRIVLVFLYGEFIYQDWIDSSLQHTTQFARQLVVHAAGTDANFTGMSVSTIPIGNHNCTDDDCDK
jgi:hypothetical protein